MIETAIDDLLHADPLGAALSPVALVLVGASALVYVRGVMRQRLVREPVSPVRHALFAAGLLIVAASFDAPLAPAARQLFTLHQIQHLLVRLIGPMLIVLAYPWPVLRAGLPAGIRQRLKAMEQFCPIARLASICTTLPVALALLIVALYVWQLPSIHNAALDKPVLLVLAHLCMTLAGLLFFAVVLDRRDAPEGAPQAGRLLVLCCVIVSNILLGSLTTLKQEVLYPAYDVAGRLYDWTPLSDEILGGYIIWVPSSVTMIAAIMVVFNGWNRAEEERWNRRYDWAGGANVAALEFPETAEELWIKVKERNRRMGQTLGLATLTMFAIVLVTAISVVTLL